MAKAVLKWLKWGGLGFIALLALLFMYVWFVVFAEPKRIGSMAEISGEGFHTVLLGEPTACSNGSPFAIYVRRGSSDNLIIHFSGGGACWDSATCAAPITYSSFLEDNSEQLKSFFLPEIYKVVPALIPAMLGGDDAGNPFKDWNVVFVPYCTGDLHVGNATNTYTHNGRPIKIRHNGRNNSMAALNWVSGNFKTPGKILVSGESAGAWASAFWAPVVAGRYAGTRVYQLSDGSLIASGRWKEILDTVWKAEGAAFLNFSIGNDIFEDALLHRADSVNYRIKHLHSNTVYDLVLPKFGAALNHYSTDNHGYINNWSQQMLASMQRLNASGLDYEYFLSDCRYDAKTHSTPHTLTGRDFYRCRAGDVSYPAWLKSNVIDDKPMSAGGNLLSVKQ